MLSWLIPSSIAVLAMLLNGYQYFHPRILCKVRYLIKDQRRENVPCPISLADCVDVTDHSIEVHQRFVNLVGKIIEVKSLGNVAARGILVHVKLKHRIYEWEVAKDEQTSLPYGQFEEGEFNIKVDCLNPADELRILLWCDAEAVGDDDILAEHRVTLNEGKAKLARK